MIFRFKVDSTSWNLDSRACVYVGGFVSRDLVSEACILLGFKFMVSDL